MPKTTQNGLTHSLKTHLARTRLWTASGLWLEESIRAFWPLFYWGGLFLLLWLAGPFFLKDPYNFYRYSALAFYSGIVVLGLRGFFLFRIPKRSDIDTWIEQGPAAHHRPLSALKDTLSNPGHARTETLWAGRFEDLFPALAKLRARLPGSVLPAKDPAALRVLLGVIVMVSFIVTGSAQGLEQIRQGLWPLTPGQDLLGRVKNAEVILTPPVYTHQDTLKVTGIQREDDAPVLIPAGSTYEVNVSGGISTPKIFMDQKAVSLEKTSDGFYKGTGTLATARTFKVNQLFSKRVFFQYRLKIDTPPKLSRNGDIEILRSGELKIPLTVLDDYGLEKIQIRVDSTGDKKPLIGAAYDEIKTVMTKGGAEAQDIEPVFDLTFHPWTGQKVLLTLIGLDAKGQSDALAPIEITLPDRPFYNKTARQIIALRKRLIEKPEQAYSEVQTGLIRAVERPAAYNGDKVVFLGLSSAIYRLQYNPNLETTRALIDLLWNIALRIEDGGAEDGYKNLQEIQQKLADALADPNSSADDIAELMQEFQMALARYFQQLAQSAALQMQNKTGQMDAQQMMNMEMLSSMITPQDLAQFLNEMQRQIMSGDKQAAREMLSRLSSLMQSMRPGAMNTQLPPEIKELQKQMEALRNLTEQQKELRHSVYQKIEHVDDYERHQRTLKALEDIPGIEEMLKKLNPETEKLFQPPQISLEMGKEHKAQEDLYDDLQNIMKQIDEVVKQTPSNLKRAGDAMRGASEFLSQNTPASALIDQDKAIFELENTQKQMNEQMAQMLQKMMGLSFGGMPRLDPFGRPSQDGENGRLNPLLGREVKIPDKAEQRKIDEILQILRKRSGELSRPAEEREYYKRLLEQF